MRTGVGIVVLSAFLWLPAREFAWAQSAARRTPPAEPPPVTDLRIDPLILGSVLEFRNIIRTIGADIFPLWRANAVPMLLYRPLVQDILVGAPRRPPGYSRYTGPSPLAGEVIYARNDSTLKDLDDQNTSTELDSMRVLVVADQYSRLRNTLRALYGRPGPFVQEWLDNWNFVPSPYDELQLLLHEAFHVHQDRLAPDKGANEGAVARYPVLDATNNALFALEGLALRDALLATDPAVRRERAGMFIALRLARREALDTAAISYENLNEYAEGLGRYVEYRFMQLSSRVTPGPQMYLHAGFTGYRGRLDREFARRIDDMVRVAGNTDDRFGNRYGAGPLRFRLYDLGAAQGLLCDDFAPGWKQRIFGAGVYLTDELARGLALTDGQRANLLARAKAEYHFERVLSEKESFAAAGRRLIQQRVDSLLSTPGTLVTIGYAAAGDRLGLGYTPFGVTAVNDQAAIYDMVPIAVRFPNRVLLQMKGVRPVLIDRAARTVQFAVDTPASAFTPAAVAGGDFADFSLEANPGTTIVVSGNRVRIEMH